MDILQIALIFLIALLSIFLAITGFQVFFILRDLKKALDRLNNVLQTGQNLEEDIERPVAAASSLIAAIRGRAKLARAGSKPKRFYKRTL